MAARYYTAAGTSQVLRYFYPMMQLAEEGGAYSDYLAALRQIGDDDPTALANATIQDRQAMWGNIQAQMGAIDAFAAAPLDAPLDNTMISWAPGHQATATSDLFERYQVRVEFDTSTTQPGEPLTRTVTIPGDLSGYTKETFVAELTGALQEQLDIGDTPEAGGWGPAGPGLVGDLSNVTIMRI